jgi:hypothetical protein
MPEYRLGRVAGLDVSFVRSTFIGMLVIFALSTLLLMSRFPLGQALLGGLLSTVLYWFSEFIHQWGHARAARSTGHPMTGIRFWGALSSSLYPANEATLPAEVHIRRALGGPIISLTAAVILGALLMALLPQSDGLPWWVMLFVFLINLFVFGLGSFAPLGFTDGSTLLYWWPKRGQR